MLLTSFSMAEAIPLLILGGIAIVVFTIAIGMLVRQSREAAKYKQIAETKDETIKQQNKATAVLLERVSNSELGNKLRRGKF